MTLCFEDLHCCSWSAFQKTVWNGEPFCAQALLHRQPLTSVGREHCNPGRLVEASFWTNLAARKKVAAVQSQGSTWFDAGFTLVTPLSS